MCCCVVTLWNTVNIFYKCLVAITCMPVQRNDTLGQPYHHRALMLDKHRLVSVSPPIYPNLPYFTRDTLQFPQTASETETALPLRSQTSKIEWWVSVKCETHSEYTISIVPAGVINRKRGGGFTKHCTTNMRNRAGSHLTHMQCLNTSEADCMMVDGNET